MARATSLIVQLTSAWRSKSLSPGVVSAIISSQRHRRPPTLASEVVDHSVVGDSVEPGRKRKSLELELVDRFDHLEEHLSGEVFCFQLIAALEDDVPVDLVVVHLIQPTERGRVTGLRQSHDVFNRVCVCWCGCHLCLSRQRSRQSLGTLRMPVIVCDHTRTDSRTMKFG